MKLCRIRNPGIFITIQDLGRHGFLKYGVPISGAMDEYTFSIANLLVDNDLNDACIEITKIGPELEFLTATQIAIAGDCPFATINNENTACWQTLQVFKNDVLRIGPIRSGFRAYISVRGGIEVPLVMGSRSTYVRGGFGGFEGRKLRKGDIIKNFDDAITLEQRITLPNSLIPIYNNFSTIDVLLGPQHDYFQKNSIQTLTSNNFVITSESDRMGFRLEGPKINYKMESPMISDAIPVGAIQVPQNGKPIIMMRDAQTTGGYPKIAVVSTPDINKLAQLPYNSSIRFVEISLQEARKKLITYVNKINSLRTLLRKEDS